MKQKYAFIDRDGTLLFEPQDTFYISMDKYKLLPGVADSLSGLSADGFKLVMVTNQDHLGTDKNPQDVFDAVQDKLVKRLKTEKVVFDQVLVCPHGPDDSCICRKPKTGLVDHIDDIDKTSSVVIGDRESDVGFAKNLGIKAIKLEVNQGIKL
jgi:imidazoleglycerol-phosphate dehydratase/histidinol-phosphatase